MARCKCGSASGIPSKIPMHDCTKGKGSKSVSTGADLAGNKPSLRDGRHEKPLNVKNPLNGKR